MPTETEGAAKSEIDFERFRDRIWCNPFHVFLGFDLVSVSDQGIEARVEMRRELMGNNGARRLHGGVLASLLDGVCGYLGGIAVARREPETLNGAGERRLDHLATVDMHVEFVRPARAKQYIARSSLIYVGSSIIKTRGDVFDGEGHLIATATANYHY